MMSCLLVERDDRGIVTATLNRPHRRNALDMDLMVRLRELLLEVRDKEADRVLVLTGAGGAFCSGSDLDDRRNDPRHPVQRLRWISDLAVALHRLGKPAIAKVSGVAVGGGLSLALGCDFIVASEEARLGTGWVHRSLSPDLGASWLLPRWVGLHKAKELVCLGPMLSAREALEIGLVNKVVPAQELDAQVDQWALQLAAGPTLALSFSKAMLNESLGTSLTQALEAEALALSVNLASDDGREAMEAFAARRPPQFRGR